MCNQPCESCSKGCARVTDLDVAEAGVQPAVQAATQEAILAELKAIRELLECKTQPILVDIAR